MTVLEETHFAISRPDSDSPYQLTKRQGRVVGESEILLRVDTAGLCGTDIQIARGMRHEEASVIGHEGLCEVIAVGLGMAANYKVGERIVINPTSAEDSTFLLGHTIDGMFQSHILVDARAHRLGQLIKVTEPIDRELACLIEPLACVLYSISILKPFRPDVAFIFGDGTIGRLAQIQIPLSTNLKDARLVNREDFYGGPNQSLGPTLAKRCAVIIATPRDSTVDCVNHVIENSTTKTLVDVVGGFAAGTNPLLVEIQRARAANVAGTPAQATIHTTKANNQSEAAIRFTGHRGVSAEHIRLAIALLAKYPDTYRPLVTHLVSPRGAADVLNALSSGHHREYEGRRIIKLAIDMTAEGTQW